MVTVPRNAPCPCGSGRKYKRCCGQRDDDLARELDDVPRALEALIAFGERDEFRDDWELAQTVFWGAWADTLADEELDELDEEGMSTVFWLGFAVDLLLDGERSICARLLEQRAAKLSPGVKRCLAKLETTYMDVYRVRAAADGDGMDFISVLDSSRHRVTEPPLPDDAAGLVMVARLYPLADGEAALVGGAYDFEADAEAALLELLQRERAVFEGLQGPLETPAFLRQMGLRFHTLWLASQLGEAYAGAPRAIFDLVHVARVVRALDACEDTEVTDDDEWTCAKGRGGNSEDVTIEILDGLLTVTGETADDVEAVVALLERIVPRSLERLEDDEEGDPLDPADFGVEEEF